MLKHVQDLRLYATNISGLLLPYERLRVLPTPSTALTALSPATPPPGTAVPDAGSTSPPHLTAGYTAARRKEGTETAAAASPPPSASASAPTSRRSQAAPRVISRGPAARERQTPSRQGRLPAGAATAADGSGLSRGRAATYSLSAMIGAGRERAGACAGTTQAACLRGQGPALRKDPAFGCPRRCRTAVRSPGWPANACVASACGAFALDTEGTRGAASRRTAQPCVAPRSAPVCGKSPPAAHCEHLRVFLNLISPRSHQNYNGEGK